MNQDIIKTLITKDGKRVLTCEIDYDASEPAHDHTTLIIIYPTSTIVDALVTYAFDNDRDAYNDVVKGASDMDSIFDNLSSALAGKFWIAPICGFSDDPSSYKVGISDPDRPHLAGFAICDLQDSVIYKSQEDWIKSYVNPYLKQKADYEQGTVYVVDYRDAETDEILDSISNCYFDDDKSLTENMLILLPEFYAELYDNTYSDPNDWTDGYQETVVTHKYYKDKLD